MGMSPSRVRARTPATGGEWMDADLAAMYAGVTLAVFSAALRDGELSRTPGSHILSAVRVHSHAVEAWAAEREARPVALAS
jgi:hypothetical protein